MNKTVLGVAMVVVFCITFWIVAGEAWGYARTMETRCGFCGVYMSRWRTQASWGVGAGLLADLLLLVGALVWSKLTAKA